MRRSPSGWGQDDFRTLYEGFGFVNKGGGNHTVYIHERFKQLRAVVARHNSLAKGYTTHAIKLIDQLKALEAEEAEEADEQE